MRKTLTRVSLFVVSVLAPVLFACMVPAVVSQAYDPLDYYDEPELDKYNPETDYRIIIIDGANLLSSDEIKQLANDMATITNYGNVAFVTTDYNSVGDIMRYSEKLYKKLFGTESGTMLIIDMDEREISIYSDGAVHRVITDGYGYDITDNIYRYATNGDYYTCASKAFEQMTMLLEGQKIARPMKVVCSAFMALLTSFLICFFIVNGASKIQNTSNAEMLSGAAKSLRYTTPRVVKTGETRTYSPQSSGSGGGGGGSRGGGGGGHHSGGGGHHGF